jgi:trimeric autotransporter adhesin
MPRRGGAVASASRPSSTQSCRWQRRQRAPDRTHESAVSVTPSSGSGATQTFALRYSHSSGAAELQTVHVDIRVSFESSATNSCLVFYDHRAHSLSLATDGLSDWRSASLATDATLQNSQCAIAVGSSSVTLAGNTLTLKLAMTFKPEFAGSKNIYMYAFAGTAVSGWHDRGDWTVPRP